MDKGVVAKAGKELFANADKEILVEIVKFAQKQGLKGAKGGWKEFLNSQDRKFGDHLSDPSRRSPDVLIAFLNTFFEEEKKIFSNMLRRHKNHALIMKHMRPAVDKDHSVQGLVRLTHEHPNYVARYSFPSLNKDWVVIPLRKISNSSKPPDVIAIDCEMVLCQDGTEAVAQVCVVDKNLEVKLNLLIKPSGPVVDYRTDITGIVAGDLDNVTTSLADAQKSLKKLLRHGTILVGHSLHNDLQALRIDHPLVIDTTHIFKYANTFLRTPSLNNLCKSVLGYKIRNEGEPHNCLGDAQAAMKLVLAKLEHGFDKPIEIEMESGNTQKLLLHRIPVEVSSTELVKLFLPKFDVKIQADSKIRGQFYATYALFKDSSVADEAFLEARGSNETDNFGRPQKLVALQLSTGKVVNFYVRRMMPFPLPSNKEQQSSSKDETEFVDNIKTYPDDKRDNYRKAHSMYENDEYLHNEENNKENTKKKRRLNGQKEVKTTDTSGNVKTTSGGHVIDDNVSCSCKQHMEQIGKLKEELRQRDHEIQNLKKMLLEYLARNTK